MSPEMLAPSPAPAGQRRQCMRPPCSNLAIYPPYLYVGHGDRRDHLCLPTVVTVVAAGGVRRGWRC